MRGFVIEANKNGAVDSRRFLSDVIEGSINALISTFLFLVDTDIQNLGKPINSPSDDFGLVKRGEDDGYFTSNRLTDGAKGDDDIYYFIDKTPEIHIIHYLLTGVSYGNDDGDVSVLPDTKITLKDSNGQAIEEVVADGSGNFRFKNEIEVCAFLLRISACDNKRALLLVGFALYAISRLVCALILSLLFNCNCPRSPLIKGSSLY